MRTDIGNFSQTDPWCRLPRVDLACVRACERGETISRLVSALEASPNLRIYIYIYTRQDPSISIDGVELDLILVWFRSLRRIWTTKFRARLSITNSDTNLMTLQIQLESTQHFLLHCHIFDVHREKLLEDINPFIRQLNLNPEDFVYGNESLAIHENKAILR